MNTTRTGAIVLVVRGVGSGERDNRVIRDTPTTTNPASGKSAGRDPALYRPSGRPDPACGLAGAVLVWHA